MNYKPLSVVFSILRGFFVVLICCYKFLLFYEKLVYRMGIVYDIWFEEKKVKTEEKGDGNE